MTADYWPLYVALDIVLGPDTDRPDRSLGRDVHPPGAGARARRRDAVGRRPDRGRSSRRRARVFAAQPPAAARDAARARADVLSRRAARSGCCSSCSAGLRAARDLARAARVACGRCFGLLLAVWGLVAGFVGCFLVYVWALTDHVVAHHNQNILLFAPWAIALVGARDRRRARLAAGARGRPRRRPGGARRRARRRLLKVGIVRHQENERLLAFALPAWLGIYATLAFYVGGGVRPTAPEPVADARTSAGRPRTSERGISARFFAKSLLANPAEQAI